MLGISDNDCKEAVTQVANTSLKLLLYNWLIRTDITPHRSEVFCVVSGGGPGEYQCRDVRCIAK